MKVHFLGAYCPLVKSISPTETESYPLVEKFTSYTENVSTARDLAKHIVLHADQGHCLLKGNIKQPLVDEPRRGSTNTDEATQFICLDFDKHKASDIETLLTTMGLADVSYILQYSASHGLPGTEGTVSAHVFMLLETPMPAPAIKSWLMEMNLTVFRADITLSRSKNVLHWPLDITSCQNDRLLFIAPPKFIDIKDPLFKRISYVPKTLDTIPSDRIPEKYLGALKHDAQSLLNALRKAEGLKPKTERTVWVGAIEVSSKPDACTVTGIKQTGDFIRLNINGDTTWAHWHPVDNFELIHSFRSDTWYKTKELIPQYYAQQVQARADLAATPTDDGDLILAFRDLSSAVYYNGLWNPAQQHLELYKAKNETQLDHWMKSHGRTIGTFIPIWNIEYQPRQTWIVDADNHKINTFQRSKYMDLVPDPAAQFPHIMEIIKHMLGWSTPADDKLVDHFLNWFACIFQRKHKPLTAWVAHGTEGTGKGYFVKKIVTALLNATNVQTALIGNLEDSFNAWMEGKLFVFVDEIDVDDFSEKGRLTSKLKNYITEPTISSRDMRAVMRDVVNWTAFFFSSNMPRPVCIPLHDRRYNVGNFQARKLPRPDDDAVSAELEAFAQFLLAHKADIIQADSIIETEARKEIQKLGVTSIDQTCHDILTGDFEALWMTRPDEALMTNSSIITPHSQNARAYCMLMRDIASQCLKNAHTMRNYVMSRDEILIILQYNVGNMPVTPNKFTALLRHHNINTKPLRKNGCLIRGLSINWKISEEFRTELQQYLIQSEPVIRRVK